MKLPDMKNVSNSILESPRPAFAKMIDEDIRRCETFLNPENKYDEQNARQFHIELTAKYSSYIDNIGSDMYECYRDGKSFDTDALSKESLLHNLFVLKNKLISFKNYGYRNRGLRERGINIENNLTATQTQTINITFEAVKRQIEDMTGLSDSETQETLDKVDEIKSIVEANGTKKSKWQKIKPILAWLADKSVDVGCALLPLILKIGE